MELGLVPFDLHLEQQQAPTLSGWSSGSSLCPVCLSPDGTGGEENDVKVSLKSKFEFFERCVKGALLSLSEFLRPLRPWKQATS